MRTMTILAVLATLLLAAPTPGRAEDDAGEVSLRFENAPVAKVLAKIARLAGRNMIVSPKLDMTVSIAIEGVPWRHALEMIVKQIDAKVIEEEHGILRIVPADEARAKDRLRSVDGRRVGEARKEHDMAAKRARGKYASALAKLAEMSRRLDEQRADAADEKALARTEAQMKELEAFTERLRANVADIERRSARAEDELVKERFELEAVRLRAAKLQAELLRARKRPGHAPLEEELTEEVEDETADHGVLQIYEISDLVKTAPAGAWNFKHPRYGVRELKMDGRKLVARATRSGHRHIAAHLNELRQHAGVRDAKGHRIAGSVVHAREAREALERAEHLEKAAHYLEAAGREEEARRAIENARELRAAAKRRRADPRAGNLVESVNALRSDVRALREQVAHLTHLVRQLLGPRGGKGGKGGRAGGKGGKGGRVWVPGRAGKPGGPGQPGEPGTAGRWEKK